MAHRGVRLRLVVQRSRGIRLDRQRKVRRTASYNRSRALQDHIEAMSSRRHSESYPFLLNQIVADDLRKVSFDPRMID